MGLNLEYSGGQTPVDADELVGIRIKTISTRKELDEFEQKNIDTFAKTFKNEPQSRIRVDPWVS